jgi:acetyltransferase
MLYNESELQFPLAGLNKLLDVRKVVYTMTIPNDQHASSEVLGRYPQDWIERIVLQDGTAVTIRPIRPEDAPKLQSAFKRLSTQSVYYRFLQVFEQLTDQQARDFADLDYHQRMALVAEIQEAGESNLIGVARYAMVPGDEPGLAESAVVVIDEYQKRGLGSLLLMRLVRYALSHDVQTFLATVHVSNAQIMRFIRRSGLPAEKKMIEPGVWEIRIRLQDGI